MPRTKRLPDLELRDALVLLVELLAPACSSLGSNRVPPDQFDYTQAIGQA